MRVIEQSSFRDEDGEISLGDRIRATLDHGLGWYGEMMAQESFTERLQRHLADDHLLLRNAMLPGSDLTVPLILLGPEGVRTIIATDKKGIFRAKGENWYAFSGRTRRFRPKRPNLQSLATSYAQAVHAYLQRQGVPLPEVEPVLAFTNPRTHVDTAQPSVRIVQADAFDHFASNLLKFQPIMDQEDVNELTDLILNPPQPEPEPEPADEPLAAPEEPTDRQVSPSEVDAFRLDDSPAARRASRSRFSFSRGQWIILGLLLLMEIVVVLAFATLILTNSYL